jgi:hypothetical protein
LQNPGPFDGAEAEPPRGSAAAFYLANKRRLERLKAEAAKYSRRDVERIYGMIASLLTDICASPRIMGDATAHKHVLNIMRTADPERLNDEMRLLAGRLAELVDDLSGQRKGELAVGRAPAAPIHSPGPLPRPSGRMHLKL